MCTLIMNPNGCGPLPSSQLDGAVFAGGFYAPFVMNRFTQDVVPQPAGTKQTTIYWLVSTWNPYVVVVMQSTLQLTE